MGHLPLRILISAGLAGLIQSQAGAYARPAGRSGLCAPPVASAWNGPYGPGQGFVILGDGFGPKPTIRLMDRAGAHGMDIPVTWSDHEQILGIVPENLSAGTLRVRISSDQCSGGEIALNAPEVWWRWPSIAYPTDDIRLFGRNLNTSLGVVLRSKEREILLRHVVQDGPFSIRAKLPPQLRDGTYEIQAVDDANRTQTFTIVVRRAPAAAVVGGHDGAALQRSLVEMGKHGGGVVRIPPGLYQFRHAIVIPRGVTLVGAGAERTILAFDQEVPRTKGLAKKLLGYAESYTSPDPTPGVAGDPARAAVLILESDAGLEDLSIDGGGAADQGIAVAGSKRRRLERISLRRIRVQNLGPFHAQPGLTEAVLARHVDDLRIVDSKLIGNGPAVYLEDVTAAKIAFNVMRGGGEGIVSSREGGLRESIIENNRFESGGRYPQGTRMAWLSTLFGSTANNYVAENIGAHFHPPPGTDQNRGEAILFETALSHPYFGQGVAAGKDFIELPLRGPNWKLLDDDHRIRGTRLTDYFAVVLKGRGQGQARRLSWRHLNRIGLDHPWRVAPDEKSTIVITELNYRNIVYHNGIDDAMMGVLFWVNGVENIVSANTISNVERDGVYFYGDAMGGPQSERAFWPIVGNNLAGFNRGAGPSFLNAVIGNQVDSAAKGVSIGVGDFASARGPLLFPMSVGNIVEGNIIRKTPIGIRVEQILKYAGGRGVPGPTLAGEVVERNLVVGASTPIILDGRVQGAVVRENETPADNEASDRLPERRVSAPHSAYNSSGQATPRGISDRHGEK